MAIVDLPVPAIGLELQKSTPMDRETAQMAEETERIGRWIPVKEGMLMPEKK